MVLAMPRATALTLVISASPSLPGGVLTAIKMKSDAWTALPRSVVKGKALAHVSVDHFFQARLENRHHALLQTLDFFAVHVHANDLVAQVRETGPGHQTHITRTYHRDTHKYLLHR